MWGDVNQLALRLNIFILRQTSYQLVPSTLNENTLGQRSGWLPTASSFKGAYLNSYLCCYMDIAKNVAMDDFYQHISCCFISTNVF